MKRNKISCIVMLALSFLVLLILSSCGNKDDIKPMDYRQEMRNFVISIGQYAKSLDPDFIIIPQNGIELITNNSETITDLNSSYFDAVNGFGQEDLYYGYYANDLSTPGDVTNYLNSYLSKARTNGKTILVTDYCFSLEKIANSYNQNNSNNYVSFAANSRELDRIPFFPKEPYKINDSPIADLSQIKNFLYIINTELYSSKEEFIDSVSATNYDLIILDLFFKDGKNFSVGEIAELKAKPGGARRLVVCYLSVGEAENYRYYWQPDWDSINPEWMEEENPYWPGNYGVKYWIPEWQNIIYGNDSSYAQKAINAGFDGLYLDIIDAYEKYE